MSDTGTRQVDCAEALRKMHEYLDGELDPALLPAIRDHLAACLDCRIEYRVVEAVITRVRTACGNDEAPKELREKVLLRIEQVRVRILESGQP